MTLETGVKALAEAVAVDVKALGEGKVDKELGKGLSDTNYTQGEKTKLAGIASEATKNRDDTLNADKIHGHIISDVTGLQTALDGKVGTGDTRLTNSREWSATTVTQPVAEAGTSTERFAWTAQRVRQGITAWFTGISGALGRTILGRGTAAEVRGDLGLGTAATKNVGVAAGTVMEVGAGGLLGASRSVEDIDNVQGSCFLKFPAGSIGISLAGWGIQCSDGAYSGYDFQMKARGLDVACRTSTNGIWTESYRLYHTANLLNIGTTAAEARAALQLTDAIANIPSVPKSAAYTVTATDKGASIDTSAAVTIPASVFTVGDVIVVTNTSASSISITPSAGVTFRLAGTTSTGARTLAGYGVATFRMASSNVWFASGAGLS